MSSKILWDTLQNSAGYCWLDPNFYTRISLDLEKPFTLALGVISFFFLSSSVERVRETQRSEDTNSQQHKVRYFWFETTNFQPELKKKISNIKK